MAAPAVPCEAIIRHHHQQIPGPDDEERGGVAERAGLWPWTAVCGLLQGELSWSAEVCHHERSRPEIIRSKECGLQRGPLARGELIPYLISKKHILLIFFYSSIL